MKILAICGSPRKGNSYSALNTIIKHYPEIDFELIMLKDLQFELCKGCYVCVRHGEEKCPIKDDRDLLIRKINAADGLILASPTYSHMVPALMKNFFDRLGFYAHRPEFFGKYAMSLVTCSGYGALHAKNYMDKLLKIFGFNLAPSIELQFKPGKDRNTQRTENKEKILAGFQTLVSKIQSGAIDKPTLHKLIPFGIFKTIAEAAKNTMPADYNYYKNKKEYYYETHIPFFKRWIAKRVVKKEMERILS